MEQVVRSGAARTRCVMCRELVRDECDAVLVPMQGKWAVAAHRWCWEQLSVQSLEPRASSPEVGAQP